MNEAFASNKNRYLKSDYSFCPYCDKNELIADELRDEGFNAWRRVECKACLKNWNEIYTMTDIEERS